ncbi:MAG TPA: DUF917 domain-containing protein [Parachlamydiaceae bacterium]|nr:DUF917 domain-containing protein [Parachlamydiaceae bacterium]
MKKLNALGLHDLAVGSAILGSGGGGTTEPALMMAKYQMEKNGPASLINFSDLKPDDVIMPIGYMGAPSADTEKLASGNEFQVMFEHVEKVLKKKVTVLLPFEIGGGNALIPFVEGARLGLPVLDADTMGRAFPEMTMCSCYLFGASASPGFITDCLGNTVVMHGECVETLERIGRQVVISMGSTAAFGFYPLTTETVEKYTIHKSISKAMSIGKLIREAKKNGKDPIDDLLDHCKGIKIGSGTITDIDRTISRGFLHGNVNIQSKDEKMELAFKNEFLLAKCNGKIVATTPDIIMLLEQETGATIDTEQLQYGLKVHLIALPAPTLWTTPQGLDLVGPGHFGYETDYHPICPIVRNSHEKNYH